MAPKATPAIDAKTLAVDYGFALSVLNSNPELQRLFKQAVAQTWTGDKFIAELRGTSWFQHHSDTAREWIILNASDKGTADQRRRQRVTTIQAEAAQLGVHLNTTQLRSIRDNSLLFGWTDQQMRVAIGAAWKNMPTTATYGLAGTTIDQLKATAADYAVPISNDALHSWTQKVLQGLAQPEDFKNYAIEQAKSLFPTMAASLDKGVTVAQYADPYKQSAVQILGINPEDFNLMDPKWRKAIDQVDPKSGQRTVSTLADWQTALRTNTVYGFDKTTQGRQQASQLTDQLASTFGFK